MLFSRAGRCNHLIFFLMLHHCPINIWLGKSMLHDSELKWPNTSSACSIMVLLLMISCSGATLSRHREIANPDMDHALSVKSEFGIICSWNQWSYFLFSYESCFETSWRGLSLCLWRGKIIHMFIKGFYLIQKPFYFPQDVVLSTWMNSCFLSSLRKRENKVLLKILLFTKTSNNQYFFWLHPAWSKPNFRSAMLQYWMGPGVTIRHEKFKAYNDPPTELCKSSNPIHV